MTLLQIAVTCPVSGERLFWNHKRRDFFAESEQVPTPFPDRVSVAKELALRVEPIYGREGVTVEPYGLDD